MSAGWTGVAAVTAGAALLAGQGWIALARTGAPVHLLARAQLTTVGPVLLVVVLVLFACERLRPAEARGTRAKAHATDVAYLAVFAAAAPLVTLLDTGCTVELHRHASFLVFGRLPVGSRLAVTATILVGIDAANWAAHLANHRSTALWRFHALHHSQEQMSVFTTFRTHPLAHAAYVPALLPAFALGASGALPAGAVVGYGCLVALTHANLPWTFGRLGWLVVSPAYHRVHHAREPVGDQVSNFGFVLTCWDRLAGLATNPDGVVRPTGITGRPVPVEQARGARLLPTLARQLLQPFQIGDAMEPPR